MTDTDTDPESSKDTDKDLNLELRRVYSLWPDLNPDPMARLKPLTSSSSSPSLFSGPALLPSSLSSSSSLSESKESKSDFENLWSYKCKHVTKDGRYYILSTNIVASDGTCRVKWSKYSADESLAETRSGEEEKEYETSLEDFIKMIDDKKWERLGDVSVIVK